MVLLLLTVFVVILLLSRRQKLQGSPTILRNPFGVTINMKVINSNKVGKGNFWVSGAFDEPSAI